MLDHGELISNLRKALAHLDDPLYLETLPLVRQISFAAHPSNLSRGQGLRRALRLAIDALAPDSGTAFSAIDVRTYEVLYRYAISRQSMIAISSQLCISERQAYRELRRGIQALAQVLSNSMESSTDQPSPPSEEPARPPIKAPGEVEWLGVNDQDVDITRLIRGVLDTVRALSAARGIEIELTLETHDSHVTANRVALRQTILNLLSYIIESTQEGQNIQVNLYHSDVSALVEFVYRLQAPTSPKGAQSPYAIATQLLGLMDIGWTQKQTNDGKYHLSFWLPLATERKVLIIDDNEDLIALFRRYLQGQPYKVQDAKDFTEALRMVSRLRPDVVILDVMMPDRDGWEILQTLRASQARYTPRIVVCSIINDPQLAASLGADAFLNKPVTRQQLLQILQEVLSSPT